MSYLKGRHTKTLPHHQQQQQVIHYNNNNNSTTSSSSSNSPPPALNNNEHFQQEVVYQPAAEMTYKPYLLKEDGEQKMPLFLIKLWNIVEDSAYREVVRWDETGLSFHIMDPYTFCSNILPQYFKHKNLNSLVRQLNMYGFRKNTPIDRTGLARAESDQDHLEFMHPYFRRDHPELLGNIKRKVAGNKSSATAIQIQRQTTAAALATVGGAAIAVPTKDLTSIFDELKSLRERQKNMEMRMEQLTKENEMLWTEMAHVRGTHLKQQQIVNKLIQFLVALVGPNKQQGRLGKRHMYVLEEGGGTSAGDASGAGDAKRFREVEIGEGDIFGHFGLAGDGGADVNVGGGSSSMGATPVHQLQSILPPNATEILDRLISDIHQSGATATFGTGTGSGNYMFEHDPRQSRPFIRTVPDKIDPNLDMGGGVILDWTTNDTNQQQLQPYTGGNHGGGGGGLRTIPSGPIIAELTEEMDQPFITDYPGGGLAMGQIQVDGTGAGQQQIVVSSPLTPMVAATSPQQYVVMEQSPQGFPGYNQSFSSSSSAPAPKKPAYREQPQSKPKTIQMALQQPAGRQRMAQQQKQQPMIAMVPPQQQQQRMMISTQQQQPPQMQQPTVQPNNRPTAPPAAGRSVMAGQKYQQSAPQQQQQFGQVPPQQKPIANIAPVNGGLGSADYSQQNPQFDAGIQSGTLDVPLTEGMMLTEQEMADIAGLNAYLDQANNALPDDNHSRFQTLTNTIGEHWDGVDGGLDPDLEFQDLFDYGPSDVEQQQQEEGSDGSQQQYGAQRQNLVDHPNNFSPLSTMSPLK